MTLFLCASRSAVAAYPKSPSSSSLAGAPIKRAECDSLRAWPRRPLCGRRLSSKLIRPYCPGRSGDCVTAPSECTLLDIASTFGGERVRPLYSNESWSSNWEDWREKLNGLDRSCSGELMARRACESGPGIVAVDGAEAPAADISISSS